MKGEKKGEKSRNGEGEEKMGGRQEREKEEKWKGNRKGEEGKEGREKGWGREYASRIPVKTE